MKFLIKPVLSLYLRPCSFEANGKIECECPEHLYGLSCEHCSHGRVKDKSGNCVDASRPERPEQVQIESESYFLTFNNVYLETKCYSNCWSWNTYQMLQPWYAWLWSWWMYLQGMISSSFESVQTIVGKRRRRPLRPVQVWSIWWAKRRKSTRMQ